MITPEEFDAYQTKVLKYVLYKKRTKQEVKTKFCQSIEEEILEQIIEHLEENGYINDHNYIERMVNEIKALQHLSIKEIKYKLLSKGVSKNLVEDYISDHLEELLDYELDSASIIGTKKARTMETQEIEQFLYKKGYREESISYAMQQIETE